MFKASVLLVLINIFVFCENLNVSGTSYYFRSNGNEFKIYNRINFLNHNITDLDFNYNNKKGANLEVIKANEQPKLEKETLLIDTEWLHEHNTFNKTDIPLFIHKFYETRTKETFNKDTVRILFNSNRNTSSSIIKINLDSLKPQENISKAELYFYWPLDENSTIYKKSAVLRLYQMEKQINGALNESNLIDNPDVHILFTAIYISKAQRGWQIFTMKKPIENWRKGDTNLGLLLTISSYDDNKLISVFNDTNDGLFRTFAVLTVHRNDSLDKNQTTPNDHTATNITEESFRQCKKRNWFVDFQKLKWNEFIIAPEEGFTAYDCTGRCNKIRDVQQNHAKLVNIFGSRINCCVPTKYLPLPIMFFDKHGNIVIKSYENMIVDQCACR